MNQVIEFVALRENRMSIENTEAFQLRSDRPAQWLQKVCFLILRKLRAYHYGEMVTIERHRLDSKTFVEQLFKQQEGIERFFNMHPTRFLIGAEDYAKLMHEVVATQMFSFRAEYGFNREIMGFTVQVIPWMSGVLVMPPENYK